MLKNLFARRGAWWVAILLILVVLAACVAQMPAAEPATPEATTENTPAAQEVVTETVPADSNDGITATEETTATETTTETSATDAPAAEEAVAAGEVTPTVTTTGTTEVAPATASELMGGAPIASDETYKGLPIGFTEEGFAYRGDPDAPIVMIEYSDFACPFCNRYFVQTEPAMDESYVRTGQVRVVFHDFPLVSLHPNAPAAHEASLCVAAQESASQYWNYHAALFRSIEEWQGMDDPLPVFSRLAEETGVDLPVYEACMTTHEMKSVLDERIQQAFDRGFTATPSFQMLRGSDDAVFQLIGAQPYEQFAAIADSALAGEMPVAQAPEQAPDQAAEGEDSIPFWATAEGWEPDPDRPGFNMAGDEYRGSLDAPVTVIEFSDFQCPFCQRHNADTQPALDEKYVDSGKVLWVYKHFPLNIHPQAPAAGVAAECAAEQGKFWEMHQLLFDNTDQWAIDEPNEVFKTLATQVGLDADAYAACLDDPAMAERVNSDLTEGTQFVQGTPTFIIIHGSEGSIIPGALPEASFSKVLDEQLAAAGAAE